MVEDSNTAILERPFTKEEKQEAKETVAEINLLMRTILGQEASLQANFARLGNHLLKMRSKKYWLLLNDPASKEPFHSFGSYLKFLQDRFNLKRTQFYNYISISEHLLPVVGEDTVVKMGATKASEVRKMMKATGTKPPTDIVQKAVDPETTVDELRAAIFEKTHDRGEHPGTYYTLGGFYATADEKKEIERAYDVAVKVDPIIPNTTIEWAMTKEVVLRWAREFLTTYEREVRHKK